MTIIQGRDTGDEDVVRCQLCTVPATRVYYFDDGRELDLCVDCYRDALDNGPHWLKSQIDERADRTSVPAITHIEPVAEGRTLEAEILLLRLRSAVADKEWTIACANMETEHRDGWSCDWYTGMREAHAEIESILARLANWQKPEGA